MVYAMFQCRGDQSLHLCQDCITNATGRLPERDCPASIGARIQLDGCYLRYDNHSFFTGAPDFSPVAYFCSNKTSDFLVKVSIDYLIERVMNNALKQAGFASSSAYSREYALAQCLGYLTESDCWKCLSMYSHRYFCGSALGGQVYLASCYFRYEAYRFFEALPPPPPTASSLAPASNSTVPMTRKEGSKTLIAAAGIIGGTLIATLALCVILVRRFKDIQTRGWEVFENGGYSLLKSKGEAFSLKELKRATEHFDANNKLGEGGFGPVYKGKLSNGVEVAIKKLAPNSRQGKKEFMNEVNLISSMRHKNLIRLMGSCVEGHERILVYEYLPNKSLHSLLFGEPSDDRISNWSTRYGIVLGISKGLAYLHEESHLRVIHRDIKPSNILLDSQLNPVIADFGLAKFVQVNESHIQTSVAGTRGYLPLEYLLRGELSEKVDVYSFGLVSLEIISGKQNLRENGLLQWVWGLYIQSKFQDMVDTKLGDSFSLEQVTLIVRVALLCTQENPKERPSMSTVTFWLSRKSEILDIPKKPQFVELGELRASVGAHVSSKQHSHISGGTQSISKIDPTNYQQNCSSSSSASTSQCTHVSSKRHSHISCA